MRKLAYPVSYVISYSKMCFTNFIEYSSQFTKALQAVCKVPCSECPLHDGHNPNPYSDCIIMSTRDIISRCMVNSTPRGRNPMEKI